MRFPTQDEINQALCEADLAAKRARRPAPREQTDAVVELRAAGLRPPWEAPVPPMTGIVDVMREPLPPRPAEAVPTGPPLAYYCGECGKVFSVKQYKTAGMAQAQRSKHMKRNHTKVEVPGI